jgi:hypothetical protein
MILVRNRQPPLNGNKWFIFLITGLIAVACSPKVRPVAVQPVKKEAEQSAEKKPEIKHVKPAAPKASAISLILPFGLNHLESGYTSVSLREADIAVGYYRGFKLALDSLTALGYNFKLTVYDSKDEKATAHSLGYNPAIRSSDLIVGPVFPEDIKAFTGVYTNTRQPMVSPLSPASPSTFKNSGLITIIPPLEYHAWSTARYINDRIHPQKIFILRSGFSDELEYITPFKKAIDSISRNRIKVIVLAVAHGQLNSLMPQLSEEGKNVFVVPSTNQHFLTITLHGLDTLAQSYPVTVFGHPSWANFTFLKADLLQRLDTHITSSDKVNYKAANTVTFTRSYRKAYHTDPTPFAIKGFDEGMYLGRLAATDSLKNLGPGRFTGIHNSFRFVKKPGLGWVNTHVNILKYVNFELKQVE